MPIGNGVSPVSNKVANAASLTLTWDPAPAAGTFVAVSVFTFRDITWAAGNCVDNQGVGNTYHLAATLADTGAGVSVATFFCPVIAVGSGPFTITLTPSASTWMVGFAVNKTGMSSSTTPAGSSTNTETGVTAPTTGSVSSLASAERFALATLALRNEEASIGIAGTGTWSQVVEELTFNFQPGEGDTQVATATAYEAHWTLASASDAVSCIVVFDGASGGSNQNISAGVPTTTITAPSATVDPGTATISAAAPSALFSVPAATVGGQNTTLSAGTPSAVFTAVPVTRVATRLITVAAAAALFSVPAATMVAGASLLSAGVPTIVFSVPHATITGGAEVTPTIRGPRFRGRHRNRGKRMWWLPLLLLMR